MLDRAPPPEIVTLVCVDGAGDVIDVRLLVTGPGERDQIDHGHLVLGIGKFHPAGEHLIVNRCELTDRGCMPRECFGQQRIHIIRCPVGNLLPIDDINIEGRPDIGGVSAERPLATVTAIATPLARAAT